MTTTLAPLRRDLADFAQRSRAARKRTMLEFAEQEIVLPNGPYQDRPFRASHQPYTRLIFAAIESEQWNRFVFLGPTQSGKTLSTFVIPILFHLFEIGEKVICGLPDLEMADEKWRADIKPVIERSRFRELMPRRGEGARGGKVRRAIVFENGAELQFMSGFGSDKARAGATSRVLCVTETDGMDKSSSTSREADQITQLEARTRAFRGLKRVYMECTVSTEEGRTWREYQGGTRSRIALPCPHCKLYVTSDREHFTGWEGAADELSAIDVGRFHCPECGAAWTDDERRDANVEGVLVHKGQEIAGAGVVTGEAPRTSTLGFRWSAVNNLFVTDGDVAADEWLGAEAEDRENAEREIRQFVWALPHIPSAKEFSALSRDELVVRTSGMARGALPPGVEAITVGVDVGKWMLHWTAIAWLIDGTGFVIDYGFENCLSDLVEEKAAILTALRTLRDEMCEEGWRTRDDVAIKPARVVIDSQYEPDVVHAFRRECERGEGKGRYWPSMGYGASQRGDTRTYRGPKKKTGEIVAIGEQYHVVRHRAQRSVLIEINVDHWKSRVQAMVTMPMLAADGTPNPGALSFFDADRAEHIAWARQLTSEQPVEEFAPGRGTYIVWKKKHRNNHWLDSTALAVCGGHFAGVGSIAEPRKTAGRRRGGWRSRGNTGQGKWRR